MRIKKLAEFNEWLATLKLREKKQIAARLDRVVYDDHFGTVNTRLRVDGKIEKGLAEFKFNNGIRIYFSVVEENGRFVLLIFGGNKNGQSKDIKKAAKLLRRYLEEYAGDET